MSGPRVLCFPLGYAACLNFASQCSPIFLYFSFLTDVLISFVQAFSQRPFIANLMAAQCTQGVSDEDACMFSKSLRGVKVVKLREHNFTDV